MRVCHSWRTRESTPEFLKLTLSTPLSHLWRIWYIFRIIYSVKNDIPQHNKEALSFYLRLCLGILLNLGIFIQLEVGIAAGKWKWDKKRVLIGPGRLKWVCGMYISLDTKGERFSPLVVLYFVDILLCAGKQQSLCIFQVCSYCCLPLLVGCSVCGYKKKTNNWRAFNNLRETDNPRWFGFHRCDNTQATFEFPWFLFIVIFVCR